MRRIGHDLTTVRPYTAKEFETIVEHHIRAKLVLSPEATSKHFRDLVQAMSGRNPAELTKTLSIL